VEVGTAGELDLRGFLGIDPTVPAGYETLRYTVRIKADGTEEQSAPSTRTCSPRRRTTST
jgi:hypothetical protein